MQPAKSTNEQMELALRYGISMIRTALENEGAVRYGPILCKAYGVESLEEIRPMVDKPYKDIDPQDLVRLMRVFTVPRMDMVMNAEHQRRMEGGHYRDENGNFCHIS